MQLVSLIHVQCNYALDIDLLDKVLSNVWTTGACTHDEYLTKALFALGKILFVCQKICQQEAISSANDFVHRPKFSQLSTKFKDAIEKIWRPTIFCQATNSVVPWKLSLVRSSYFAYMTKFLYLTFLVRQKISHISDANKVVKTKKWWVQNFQDFFCRCTTLFFVVVQTGPKLVYFPCCTLSYIMSLFGLRWWLTSTGSNW